MRLTSSALQNDQPIPAEFAFGAPDPSQHVTLSANRNPPLGWGELPEGTQSLALICHDPDVPSKPDDVNQEGRAVPADLPRVDFFHWVVVDLPPSAAQIAAGEFSDGVTARGKPGPSGPRVRGRASTITRTGSPATNRWAENTSATTVPARLGTIPSCITTCSRCTLWMWPVVPWKANSPARMSSRPWPGISSPKPR